MRYARSGADACVFRSDDRAGQYEAMDLHTVSIRNGRVEAPAFEREGFQVMASPSRIARERLGELIDANATPNEGERPINRELWEESIPAIRQVTGAREVIAYPGTTVRFSARAGRANWTSTAQYAHMDFQPDEVERLFHEALAMSGRQVAPYSRLMLIQTWRPLSEPPQDVPLAICDGRTVAPEDIVPVEYHVIRSGGASVYRSRTARYSERHRWTYFPAMSPDEIILFTGFDSAEPHTMNPLHTAFEDSTIPDAIPRISVESRFFALFD